MIEIKPITNNSYVVFDYKKRGQIITSYHSFHAQHCYVDFQLVDFDTANANELCSVLAAIVQKPLQVMTESTNTALIKFLRAAHFDLKRQCYEVEVSQAELISE